MQDRCGPMIMPGYSLFNETSGRKSCGDPKTVRREGWVAQHLGISPNAGPRIGQETLKIMIEIPKFDRNRNFRVVCHHLFTFVLRG